MWEVHFLLPRNMRCTPKDKLHAQVPSWEDSMGKAKAESEAALKETESLLNEVKSIFSAQ